MFDTGVTISWWWKAQRGSTIGELHGSWSYGNGVFSVLKAGCYFNLIALASILVTVVSIDGPLLQRASRVTTESFSDTSTITVNLSPNTSMVSHPTGYSTGRAGGIDVLSKEFLLVLQSYSAGLAIQLPYTGCNGSCTTEVIGPGFDVRCTSSVKDLVMNLTARSEVQVLNFSFDFGGRLVDAGLISFHTELRKSENRDQMTVNDCELRLSRVRYQVQLRNGTVKLLAPVEGINNTISIETLSQEAKGGGRYPSSLGGIYLSANRKWGGQASLYRNGAPFQLMSEGETPLTYLDDNSDYTWIDPTPVIISSMREILFRIAIAASNAESSQTVQANQEGQPTVYESQYGYLAVAFTVILAAILASTVNLFGWWQLDRPFSLGPFEIAKAFNAPFLKGTAYLSTSDKAFKGIMKAGIQYGELVDEHVGRTAAAQASGYDGQDVELLSYPGYREPAMIGMGSPHSVINRSK
ncbi:hypothetical protein VTL71DRAFT_7220 [Oculimacula yallundae]|uniref:Uncharacterized protein n=1 Tax=Oculimacula yallundae TaxID=86028 RepID=A0ABR4BW34_9HELO